MSEAKSPRNLYDIIGELKEGMVKQFPDQREQIIAYAENIPKVIDEFVKDGRGLDQLCAFFRQFDQIHSGKMHPNVQNEIGMMRTLIREQIEKGNILIPNPNNPKI